jgi:hypothetical protein
MPVRIEREKEERKKEKKKERESLNGCVCVCVCVQCYRNGSQILKRGILRWEGKKTRKKEKK